MIRSDLLFKGNWKWYKSGSIIWTLSIYVFYIPKISPSIIYLDIDSLVEMT